MNYKSRVNLQAIMNAYDNKSQWLDAYKLKKRTMEKIIDFITCVIFVIKDL